MTIAAGARLGRYESRSKIGEGGMGEVYLAQDTELERRIGFVQKVTDRFETDY